jgi:hypothetical protein
MAKGINFPTKKKSNVYDNTFLFGYFFIESICLSIPGGMKKTLEFFFSVILENGRVKKWEIKDILSGWFVGNV